MFLLRALTIAVLAARASLCNAATIPPGDGSLVDTPAPLINISLPLSNDLQIQCRGRQLGMNLDYGSCLDAFRQFAEGQNPRQIQIGRRGTPGNVRDLPYKWASGTR